MLTTLQAARAIAALAVVASHANLYTQAAPLARYGFLGVDFFFVLSGFIIFRMHTEDKNITEYAKSRALRIFVPYLPIGVGIALLSVAVPGLKPGGDSWAWLPTLTLLPFGGETALGVAWTLRHELVFYALFAVAMMAGRPLLLAILWPLAICVGAVAGLTDRFILAPINVEFSLGMIAAWAVSKEKLPDRWLTIAGLALLPVALMFADPGSPSRVLFGAVVALLLIPVVRRELMGKLSAPAALVLLGNASYAIYLIHNPVMTQVGRLEVSPLASFAVAIVLGVAAGLAYHFAWERPALRLLRPENEMAIRVGEVPSVRLISHASVVIEAGASRILTDPWFSGKAFNESWSLIAEPATIDYTGIDYLWISHEHPDHFHLPTLRAMPDSFKRRVTVLFQKSSDHAKMVAAFHALGFPNVCLLPHRRWVSLRDGLDVLSYQSRQIDSALAVRSPGGLVLNTNDCDFGPGDWRDIRSLIGEPDLLLNQFSLAGFDGVEADLPIVAERILDDMVAAHRALGAKVTVPFASFAYFCCPDNSFINAHANSPRDVAELFANEGLEAVFLEPGQTTTHHDNATAIAWWDLAFAQIATKPLTPKKHVTLAEIEIAFFKRHAKLKAIHGLIRYLLKPVAIDAGELGLLQLDFARGRLSQTEKPANLTIEPQPLLYMLSHDFGLQALGVSGRYRLLTSGHNWMLHRVFFAMSNAGVGLSFRKLLSTDQIAFFWQRRNDILRQVTHTLGRAIPR